MEFIKNLFEVIKDRKENPEKGAYTSELFSSGIPRISQKVGEEAVETVIESVKGDRAKMIYEMSDLLYHCLVLLAAHNLDPEDLIKELKKRHEK